MGKSLEEEYVSLAEEARERIMKDDDPIVLVERIYQLWWRWADFELFILTPTIAAISPPILIEPERTSELPDGEFVYPIFDHGFKLTTSKAQDMFAAGLSMCKLFYTIEKMIYLLIERLKSGGIDTEKEVQVTFRGHEIAQRKAFESIINLNYNVIVTNFEPGEWAERYLQTVKRLAKKGYGYPPEAPRDNYRRQIGPQPGAKL
jgi:hypothetical protein